MEGEKRVSEGGCLYTLAVTQGLKIPWGSRHGDRIIA